MISVDDKVLDAWFELLDGNISVNVHCGDIPEDETGNYVLLNYESESRLDNKHHFGTYVVITVDIVTTFENNVDVSVANGIDNEIRELVRPTTRTHGLPSQSGIQILNVLIQGGGKVLESDGAKQYYRKIIRYVNTILENGS